MDPVYPGFAPGSGTPNTAIAEAPKKPHLYIGNLSPRVTDYMLTEIFAVAGPVVSAKIIQDRNFQHGGYNYGFVEYTDMRSAEQALQTLNGRKIFDAEVRVNWAYQGQANKEDTQHHYHVFVGDLSPEVNDDVLGKAFGAFGSMSEARVMWDMNSGKSRGYGFLSFRWVVSAGPLSLVFCLFLLCTRFLPPLCCSQGFCLPMCWTAADVSSGIKQMQNKLSLP
jgi:nucleolysin TIA-1/TIAR